jgi:penicillin-binding protein 2B
LLVYVVVDEPETEYDSSVVGRYIVAPIFKSIMERSLQYLNQKPDAAQPQAPKAVAPVYETTMPKLIGMGTATAEIRAKRDGFAVTTIGSGTKVVQQYPAAYEKIAPGGQVFLVTDRLQGTRMPDFTGKSLREVMEFSSLLRIPVVSSGSGFVRQQSIKPGTVLTGKEKLQVTLQPVETPAVQEDAGETPDAADAGSGSVSGIVPATENGQASPGSASSSGSATSTP